jgi:hypothetical protein
MGVVHRSFYSREMLYPYLTVPRKLLGTCFSLLHDSLTEVGTASTSINEAFQRRKTYMASILTRPPLLMQFTEVKTPALIRFFLEEGIIPASIGVLTRPSLLTPFTEESALTVDSLHET